MPKLNAPRIQWIRTPTLLLLALYGACVPKLRSVSQSALGPSVVRAWVLESVGADYRSFLFNSTTGSFIQSGIPLVATNGAFVEGLTFDRTGKFAYVANYDGTLSEYTYNSTTGILTPTPTATIAAGDHIGSVAVEHTNTWLYVVLTGTSPGIQQYQINSSTGDLTYVGTTSPPTSSSYTIYAHPTGNWLYFLDGNSANVDQFNIDPSTGNLSQASPFSTSSGTLGVALVMTIDPQGKWLYLANSNAKTSIYNINSSNGTLGVASVYSQPYPSDAIGYHSIAVDGTSKWFYGTDNSDIYQYSITPGTGALTPLATFGAGVSTGNLTADSSGKWLFGTDGGDLFTLSITSGTGQLISQPTQSPNEGATFGQIAISPANNALLAESSDSQVSSYKFDSSTGLITQQNSYSAPTGAFPFSGTGTLSEKYAYAANYLDGTVSQFTLSHSTGLLSAMSPATVTAGSEPTAVFLEPSEKWLYVANYGDNTVSSYQVDSSTGQLQPLPSTTVGTSPTSVYVNPASTFAYVVNSGDGTISQFQIDTQGQLNTTSNIVTPGGTPQAMVMDFAGRWAYVTNSGTSSVFQYSVNSSSGLLSPMTPGTVTTGNSPLAAAIDPTSSWLYTTNIGDNTISEFSINANTGKLTAIGSISSAQYPNWINIDPTGSWLFVSNYNGGTIGQYKIDKTTGTLSFQSPNFVTTGGTPSMLFFSYY